MPLWKHDIIVVTVGKIATLWMNQQGILGLPLWKHDIIVVTAGKIPIPCMNQLNTGGATDEM